MTPLLEAIVLTPEDARQARACGIDRLEAVASIEVGGLTPDETVLRGILAAGVPTMVMLRPHARSFVYDEADMRAIFDAIAMARRLGAHGLVFGALTPERRIDTLRLEQVLDAAAGLPLTFHRAFDEAADLRQAHAVLGRYRDAGVAQVLTSGGRATASEGAERLRELVHADGIEVLAGSGVDAQSIGPLHARVQARQYHAGRGLRREHRYDAPLDPDAVARIRAALAYPPAGLSG